MHCLLKLSNLLWTTFAAWPARSCRSDASPLGRKVVADTGRGRDAGNVSSASAVGPRHGTLDRTYVLLAQDLRDSNSGLFTRPWEGAYLLPSVADAGLCLPKVTDVCSLC